MLSQEKLKMRPQQRLMHPLHILCTCYSGYALSHPGGGSSEELTRLGCRVEFISEMCAGLQIESVPLLAV